MKYTLDNCCGGPKVKRMPLVIQRPTALEKLAIEQVEATAMYEELKKSFEV